LPGNQCVKLAEGRGGGSVLVLHTRSKVGGKNQEPRSGEILPDGVWGPKNANTVWGGGIRRPERQRKKGVGKRSVVLAWGN